MASRQRRVAPKTTSRESSDLPRPSHGLESSDLSRGATCWSDREPPADKSSSLREKSVEREQPAARLKDMLRREKEKCARLQMRCAQQEAELRRREQHGARLKERLFQLADGHREKGASVEALNVVPRGRGKRDQAVKPTGMSASQEEAALRLMLERRELELGEAMKLRHGLTTLLHALRVDMEQTLKGVLGQRGSVQHDAGRLIQAELELGDHVTGGVVQSWNDVWKRLGDFLTAGCSAADTDQDKLLTRLETELKESQQLVELQQQLLQDGLFSPLPPELANSYFLEEWERLQSQWTELRHQRRHFDRERQSFTDAAIRLSHERRDFEREKAALLKQQFLDDSLLFEGVHMDDRRESTALNFSGSPASAESAAAALSGQGHHGHRVGTPGTPNLHSALNVPSMFGQ